MNNATRLINNMTIRERGDNRFEGRLTINGKRKSFYGITKVEVKKKAKEYLSLIESGYKEPEKIILNEYIEYWLVRYKYNKIELSSYSRLCRVYENQIKHTIGKKKIGDITTSDIQGFIDERANPTPNRKIEPLSISGLKKIIHLLRPCLNVAVKEGVIQKNPCDDVTLPVESCVKKKTKKQFSLDDDEITLLKNEALSKYKTSNRYKSRDYIILMLMLNLGLRVGEMLVLRWDDINFEKSIICINKTLQSRITDFRDGGDKNFSVIKDSTKTNAGMRYLPMNESVFRLIDILKEYDKDNKIESPYVACTTSSTMNTPRNLQRSLDRLVKNSSIDKHVSLHTLRHTFGSALLRKGVNIEVVSKLMGHANISITYNKYIHVIKEQQAAAMRLIDIC